MRDRVPAPVAAKLAAKAEQPDPMIGTIIEGLYRIEARIADGGMARVYRGLHLRMRSELAIKLMDTELSRDATMKSRCLAEARALTELQNNHHIVRAIDVGELPSGQLFLIMEYLKGEDLDKLLAREGPLPWPRVAAMAVQICSGLASAHRRGIIHRDMKPQNCVRVEADDSQDENHDHIKIIDFGVARRDSAEQGPTQQGFLLGTPEYLAPEFARGAKANVSTDIYALGVTLYKLLTGKVPFKGKDALDTLRLHAEGELVVPSRVAPDRDIPHEADEIVKTALAKSPKDRFASVEAMGRALRSALGLKQSGMLTLPGPLPKQPPSTAAAPDKAPQAPLAPALAAPTFEPTPKPPESVRAATSTASSPTVETSTFDRRVLLLRATLLASVSALFALGTWFVAPAKEEPSPAPTPTELPQKASVPEPVPPDEPREVDPPPAPPPTNDPSPREVIAAEERPETEPPPPVEQTPPAEVPGEAPLPPAEASPAPVAAPPAEPEPNFDYASAQKLVEEQQTYLRKTCMAKGDKPLSRLDFRIDVQPKGRAKVQVFASNKAVRACVRDVFRFYFDPSPRGGAFKYSLLETSGALRRLPVDPTFVQVPAP